ncbi:MAG TPA: carboxypeptidase-like regulatory domain-containing protein [Niastella sp.]
MKSILSLVFSAILLALIITIGCQKSNNDGPDDTNKPIEYVTASVSGRVLDNNNQPVSGAVVKAGAASTTSDINGNFKIANVSLDKNAGFVKVEKDGFFQGSRTIIVNAGVDNYISVQLIKRTVSGTVSGNTGGNITVQGGGNIVFTGNSFINTAGNSAYTGTVSVSTFFLNPTASNFDEIMPGTLRGITASNEETGLQSFGMMAVELTGAGGEKLQLASGKTATLTFPIPAELLASAPATIPLWSFNDTTGLWKEEGTATKQGTNYVGTVSHFSFWNCDYPYGLVDFKAVIKDQNGNGLYPSQVVLKIKNDSTLSLGYGYTDNTGLVSGKIPSGKTLQLRVYNLCKTLIYTKEIGPFSADADLGTVTVSNTGTSQVTVSGTVINCSAGVVTNGFVDISIDSIHNRALITNGNFSLTVTRCSSTPVTAVVTAYDLANNQVGLPTNFQVTSTTINAGQLSACGNPITRFLSFTLNGNNVNFAPPADSVARYGAGTSNTPYAVSAYHKNSNSGESVYFNFAATGTGTVPIGYVSVNYNNKMYIAQSTININITEYGNGFIGGNWSGTLRDSTNSSITVPVSLIFRTK